MHLLWFVLCHSRPVGRRPGQLGTPSMKQARLWRQCQCRLYRYGLQQVRTQALKHSTLTLISSASARDRCALCGARPVHEISFCWSQQRSSWGPRRTAQSLVRLPTEQRVCNFYHESMFHVETYQKEKGNPFAPLILVDMCPRDTVHQLAAVLLAR